MSGRVPSQSVFVAGPPASCYASPDPMALTADQKRPLIEAHRISDPDTGSADVQVALLTERINGLKAHFDANPKDHHSRLGLLKMVGKRKRLLRYIEQQDVAKFRTLKERLGIR